MLDFGYMPIIPMFVGIVIILVFLLIFLRFFPIGLWVTALFSGVRINMITLLTMRLRRVNPSLIVLNQIKLLLMLYPNFMKELQLKKLKKLYMKT